MSQPVAPRARLQTLGRLALVGLDGVEDESLQKRRRKLAVLVVLAIERRPISRDTLIEMFWGDQDEAKARHSLSDALSHVRRVLGRDAISLGRAEVGLAPGTPLRVDALELMDLARSGDDARVAALYEGPFLEGVYVDGSATFEHWVERERARLHGIAMQAFRNRCAVLASEERWSDAATLAERWLHFEPLSEEAALMRLTSLHTPGTADATRSALEEYERLSRRLEREFALTPAAAVRTFASSLRENEEVRTSSTPENAEPLKTTPAADVPNLPPIRRNWKVAKIASIALIAIVVLLAVVMRQWRTTTSFSPQRVAVLPFESSGGAETDYLRHGMVSLLSTNLDGAGELRTVDPRAVLGAMAPSDSAEISAERARELAKRLGAGSYVVGEVIGAGNTLRISASLFDANNGATIARATVAGAPAELFDIVDRVTAQLLAGRERTPDKRMRHLAALTTTSLPALKAYLQGEEHYRVGRYAAAYESFQRAIANDDRFALAHYRLAKTATWAGIWPWDSIVARSARAVGNSQRLTWRAKLVVEAFDAWMRGSYDDAERLYRQVLASSPDEVEAWYELGEVLFHCNPLRGRSSHEAREAFERVLSVEPSHRGALVHLLRISAEQGKTIEIDTLVTRAVGVSGEDWALELRALRAWALRDRDEQERLLPLLANAQDAVLERTVDRIAVHVGDLEGAEKLFPLLASAPRSREFRGRAEIGRAQLAVARGRWQQAEGHLRAAATLIPEHALVERARLAAMPFLQRPRNELSAIRDTLRAWDGNAPEAEWPPLATYNGLFPHLREYLIGLLSVRLNDLAVAERSIRVLQTMSSEGAAGEGDVQGLELARGLGASLQAHLAAARGDRAAALQALDRAPLTVSEGLLESSIGSQSAERWLRAELLRELGRYREAAAWYETLSSSLLANLPYRIPARERQTLMGR